MLLKALFYGDSGAGKTRLVGTATEHPATTPLLVLNARGQPITLRTFEHPPLVLPVKMMQSFNAPYEWILSGQPLSYLEQASTASSPFAKAVFRYFQSTMPDDRDSWKFRSIAVDSLTWVQRVALNQIVGNLDVKPGEMPQQTQIQHWGRALAQLTNLADLYYQLPIHVFLTALARHSEIPAFGTTNYHPFLWGQSALELPALAEMVARVIPIESLNQRQAMGLKRAMPEEMKGAWNVLLTKAGANFIAKWQGIVSNPEVVLNPTIGKLLQVLEDQEATPEEDWWMVE